ncbi:MFS transporter [Nonomuraea sp. NPDC004580]|uniref:MFS transporter n=1 Tax=Nonomuraea sp. NPDC004580 TaxID=3154552 RepID=UPI0033B02A99
MTGRGAAPLGRGRLLGYDAGETAGLALGPGLYALVLALSGFVAAAAPVAQSPGALTGLLLGFTALPALLMLISLPFVLRYGRLTLAGKEAV